MGLRKSQLCMKIVEVIKANFYQIDLINISFNDSKDYFQDMYFDLNNCHFNHFTEISE